MMVKGYHRFDIDAMEDRRFKLHLIPALSWKKPRLRISFGPLLGRVYTVHYLARFLVRNFHVSLRPLVVLEDFPVAPLPWAISPSTVRVADAGISHALQGSGLGGSPN